LLFKESLMTGLKFMRVDDWKPSYNYRFKSRNKYANVQQLTLACNKSLYGTFKDPRCFCNVKNITIMSTGDVTQDNNENNVEMIDFLNVRGHLIDEISDAEINVADHVQLLETVVEKCTRIKMLSLFVTDRVADPYSVTPDVELLRRLDAMSKDAYIQIDWEHDALAAKYCKAYKDLPEPKVGKIQLQAFF